MSLGRMAFRDEGWGRDWVLEGGRAFEAEAWVGEWSAREGLPCLDLHRDIEECVVEVVGSVDVFLLSGVVVIIGEDDEGGHGGEVV